MSDISEKLRAVDLNDLYLEDEDLQLDPDADAFQAPPPPPDALHLAKVSLFRRNGASPFDVGKDKRGRSYITAQIKATIVADGRPWNNSVVFDRVSTVVFPISGTCRMAGLLKPLGVTVPATTTMRQLAKLLETALEGEPLIGIETQWVARAQHGDDWVTIVRGMKRFTQRENGTYQHVIDDPETGEKVTAQATILRYIPVSQVRS